MPQLGPQYDLAKRLDTLERLVAQLAGNQLGQAFSATQSDGSVGMSITQSATGAGATALQFFQGPNTSRDPNTGMHPPLLYIGQITSNGQLVNNAAIFSRSDGSRSATIGDGGVGLLDAKGNVVFATDEATGATREGLANPWMPLPSPTPAAISSWLNTNATTWGGMAYSQFPAQHPKVWWLAQMTTDAGTNGSVQLVLTQGGQTVSGQVWTSNNGASTAINEVVALPQPFWHQVWTLTVNGQVTSGTGKVYCTVYGVYGRGT